MLGGIRSPRHLVPSRLPCRVTSTRKLAVRCLSPLGQNVNSSNKAAFFSFAVRRCLLSRRSRSRPNARCHLLRARRAADPATSAIHAALGCSAGRAGRAEHDADVSRLPWKPLPAWWDIFSDGTSSRTQMPGMLSAAVCLPLLYAPRTTGLLRAAERDGEGGDWAAREGEGTEGCCKGGGCREEHRVRGSGQGSRNGGTGWPAVTKRIRDGRGVLSEDRCSIRCEAGCSSGAAR
jgi:hypothetical protein